MASNAAISIFCIRKKKLIFLSGMSRNISRRPPLTDSKLIRQNNSAINASSAPARISLPKGAGLYPIVYTKLSLVRSVKERTAPDITVNTARQDNVTHFATFPPNVKQAIAQTIGRKILKNGKLCTNAKLIIILRCRYPDNFVQIERFIFFIEAYNQRQRKR